MLGRQTAFYFVANGFSAVFGLVNVIIFTHFFAVEAFGDYTLGFSFATFLGVFLSSSVKLVLLRDQARGDGTDVRETALAGLILGGAAAPFGYFAARIVNLPPAVAIASTGLTLAFIGYDTSQELLRAEQEAMRFMAGTIVRAILVSALGAAVALLGGSGVLLLISTTIAYVLATLSFWRHAWRKTKPQFDRERLADLFKTGAPVTLSLTLISLSAIIDRFLLANIVGVGAAGQFGASLDIVRQSLIIPAMSIASAFVPATVQLLATKGAARARLHLEKYLELLLAITLPACVGFTVVAPLVGDLVLGPKFRIVSHEAMPVFAVALLFQVMAHQYLETSFLLSNRTIFYLLNSGSVIIWNVLATTILVINFGVMGAVWGRLATEIFGFASALLLSVHAFRMPFALPRITRILLATMAMALVAHYLQSAAGKYGPIALGVIVPGAVAVYVVTGWLLNIADLRTATRQFAKTVLRPKRPVCDDVPGGLSHQEIPPSDPTKTGASTSTKSVPRDSASVMTCAPAQSEGAGI